MGDHSGQESEMIQVTDTILVVHENMALEEGSEDERQYMDEAEIHQVQPARVSGP